MLLIIHTVDIEYLYYVQSIANLSHRILHSHVHIFTLCPSFRERVRRHTVYIVINFLITILSNRIKIRMYQANFLLFIIK